MEKLTIGSKVITSQLKLASGHTHNLGAGPTWTLLVFYPGDFTPVCTKQWCDYRDHVSQFKGQDITVLGVTSGPVQRHADFAGAYQLPFEFVDDSSGTLAEQFGMKSRFGFVKRGIALIDPLGILRYCKSRTLPLWYPSVSEILKMV